MIGVNRNHPLPIGLDVGRDAVKMLQLRVAGNTLAVHASASRSLPEEARGQPQLRMAVAIELIRSMRREGGFAGNAVVAALPREIVHTKNFRLPPMPAAELDNAVHFEARNLFPFSLGEARLEYLSAGEVRQGSDTLQEVIALAARSDEIDAFVEQLHRCGLRVESLDIEPCALFRSVERFIRRREDENEVHVLLDIGYGGSQLVIGRGRDISFIKNIDIGSSHFHQAIARALGISQAEAQTLRRRLVDTQQAQESPESRDPVRQAVFDAARSTMELLGKELSLCLRYQLVTFRGQRPTRVRLLGGEACDRQLQAVLGGNVPIPVEAGHPLYSVDTAAMGIDGRSHTLGQWAVAMGLSLKRTQTRFAPRDGRPRDPIAQRVDLAAAVAQADGAAAEVAHA